MNTLHSTHIRQVLLSRHAMLAECWRRTLDNMALIQNRPAEAYPLIYQLVSQIINALLAEPFDSQAAEALGTFFARFITSDPESLRHTIEYLGFEILQELDVDELYSLIPRWAMFQGAFAAGFVVYAKTTTETSQEQLRIKLVEAYEQDTAALHASEKQLRTVVMNLPVILFTLDIFGTITFAGGRGCQALQFPPEILVGKSIFSVVRAPKIGQYITEAINGASIIDTIQIHSLVCEARYEALRGANETVLGVTCMIMDSSSRIPFCPDVSDPDPKIAGTSPEQPFFTTEHEDDLAAHKDIAPSATPLASIEALNARSNTFKDYHDCTAEEIHLIHLLALGKTNQQIAIDLGLGKKAVEKRLTKLFAKLHVQTRTMAVVEAIGLGLLNGTMHDEIGEARHSGEGEALLAQEV